MSSSTHRNGSLHSQTSNPPSLKPSVMAHGILNPQTRQKPQTLSLSKKSVQPSIHLCFLTARLWPPLQRALLWPHQALLSRPQGLRLAEELRFWLPGLWFGCRRPIEGIRFGVKNAGALGYKTLLCNVLGVRDLKETMLQFKVKQFEPT